MIIEVKNGVLTMKNIYVMILIIIVSIVSGIRTMMVHTGIPNIRVVGAVNIQHTAQEETQGRANHIKQTSNGRRLFFSQRCEATCTTSALGLPGRIICHRGLLGKKSPQTKCIPSFLSSIRRILNRYDTCGCCNVEDELDRPDYCNEAIDDAVALKAWIPGASQFSGIKTKEMEDGMYRITYDVRTRDSGHLSLATVSEFIDSIQCFFDDGTAARVIINLSKGYRIKSIPTVFPIDSLLIVRSASFGSCNLYLPTLEEQIEMQRDGYLVISSAVEKNMTQIEIVGQVGDFYSTFTYSNIEIKRVGNATRQRKMEDPCISYPVWKNPPSSGDDFFATLTVKACISASLDLIRSTVDTNEIDLRLEMPITISNKIEGVMGLKSKSASIKRIFDIDIFERTVWGFDFEWLGETVGDVKAGIFVKMPFKVELKSSLSLEVGFSQDFAVPLTTYFYEVKGRWEDGIPEISEGFTSPFSPVTSGDAKVTSYPIFNGKAGIEGFAGLVPTVSAVLFNERNRLAFEFPVGAFLGVTYSKFPPLQSTGLPATFGSCNKEHTVQFRFAIGLKDITLLYQLGYYNDFEYKGIGPGNITLYSGSRTRLDILVYCALFASDCPDDQVKCDDGRCIPNDGTRCLRGSCPRYHTACKNGKCVPYGIPCSDGTCPVGCDVRTCNDGIDCGEPGPSLVASCYGDPHIITWDGLKYDCQAVGEVILAKSLNSSFEIQGRFVSYGPVSVTTGIVIKDKGFPTVQVSYSTRPEISQNTVDLFVNGTLRDLARGSGYSSVLVAIEQGFITIFYPSTGAFIKVRSNGSWLSVYFDLPINFKQNEHIVGILGSPNFDVYDDWMDRDGFAVESPQTWQARAFGDAYKYCNTNWCIRNQSESLFTYEANGKNFSSFSMCDKVYDSKVEDAVKKPSDQLKAICGTDQACLIDGFVINSTAAGILLNDTNEIRRAKAEGLGLCSRISAKYYMIPSNTGQMPNFRLLTPYLIENVQSISFPGGSNGPLNTNAASNIGAVFESDLAFPGSGNWTLCISSDNGSRLFINNKLLAEVLVLGSACVIYDINLALNKVYSIRIEFWQTYGPHYLMLTWKGPTSSTQAIVPSCAFRTFSASNECPCIYPTTFDAAGNAYGNFIGSAGTSEIILYYNEQAIFEEVPRVCTKSKPLNVTIIQKGFIQYYAPLGSLSSGCISGGTANITVRRSNETTNNEYSLWDYVWKAGTGTRIDRGVLAYVCPNVCNSTV